MTPYNEFTYVVLKKAIVSDQGSPIPAGETGIPLRTTDDGNWIIEFEMPDGVTFETATLRLDDLDIKDASLED